MAISRTEAVLNELARGREGELAARVLKVFGASSIEECLATYAAVGAAERASIDQGVQHMTANASAAFLLSVDNETQR